MAVRKYVEVETSDDGRRGPSREVDIRDLGLIAGAKILAISGPALTLTDDHHGLILDLYHTAGITVTVPNTLRSDFYCGLSQATANQITVAAGSGSTLVAYNSQFKTAGQYALASLVAFAEDTFRLFGQTSG